jgi:adenylate cyclase
LDRAPDVAYDRGVHRVSFHPSGLGVEVPAGSTLLEATLAAGLPIARACGADGLCGRCGVRVLAGARHLEEESAEEGICKRRNRLDAELRLACCARIHGDIAITAAYW